VSPTTSKSGGKPHALQTLRDCHASFKPREASGVRSLQRRFDRCTL